MSDMRFIVRCDARTRRGWYHAEVAQRSPAAGQYRMTPDVLQWSGARAAPSRRSAALSEASRAGLTRTERGRQPLSEVGR